MKRRFLSLATTAVAVTMFAGVLAGCGKASNDTSNNGNSSNTQTSLSGSITAAGSTALQPLVDAAGKEFMDKNPDVTVNVQGGGSGTGVNQVAAGNIQIGDSDVPSKEKIKDSSLAGQLVDTPIAAQSFSIVVNKDNKVDSLTKEQIAKIFSGEITNWKDLGGDDVAIQVINRPSTSGTRAVFSKTIMVDKKVKEDIGTTQDSSGSVVTSVEATKGSISYLSTSYITPQKAPNTKALKIDGVEESTANIAAGTYPFWSYGYMITKGEAKDEVKAFIDYVIQDNNTIKKLGYIPMSELKK